MNQENFDYQFEEQYFREDQNKEIKNWGNSFGYKVTLRNQEGEPIKVEFKILTRNPNYKIYIIGDFNEWRINEKYLLRFENEFHSIEIENIKHKDKYKYLIIDSQNKEEILPDPATTYFDDNGNSIFWDYEGPQTYKKRYNFILEKDRTNKILQTDLPGLVTHYCNKEGKLGKDINEKKLFKFISESGVIREIKRLGFNSIQFLPFAQSIDGSNWKFRYLIPFQFAIQKNWGNPDEFAEMVDLFHKEGIAVIGDFVLGHIPDRKYHIFGQSSNQYGIHQWKDINGFDLYLGEETSWGTRRINYDDDKVREFFISSCIHFQKNYLIDGFRIDNVDGILRFGENGDGSERENGRKFLRELNSEIYSFNKNSIINFEAHYFYEDNAKMLVAPIKSNERALGATAYNSSRITYFFHTKYMFKAADEISIWKIKHIMEEKEWGKSNSTVADFHNHDAAAGLMEMRCTGAYAYECLKPKTIEGHIHAIGKIKVMESIISFCCEGRTLDLLQTFLLQRGTFEHDSTIWWHLTYNQANKNMLEFKRKVNLILDNEEFFPINTKYREFLNVDDKNKILVVQRKSKNYTSLIVINLASWELHNYKVGVKDGGNYKTIFNSDNIEYSGLGVSTLKQEYESKKSNNFEVLDQEIEIEKIGPYQTIVLRKENK